MELYAGKLNLNDCKKMSVKNMINKEGLCYPYFLKDLNKYLLSLDIIAETNFID